MKVANLSVRVEFYTEAITDDDDNKELKHFLNKRTEGSFPGRTCKFIISDIGALGMRYVQTSFFASKKLLRCRICQNPMATSTIV